MNSTNYFRNLECKARGDRYEGTHHIVQPEQIRKFTIKGESGIETGISRQAFASPLRINLGGHVINVFCMFALYHFVPPPVVDERNFCFGDSFVVVLNTQDFIDRFAASATANGLKFELGRVEYYDEKIYTGETWIFRKPKCLAYQSEFRFAISPGTIRPVVIDIGSLESLTTPVLPAKQVNSLVRLSPADDEECC
jgi:hypothetical protein